ncbi:hypothetical protein EYR40_010604 [Pleurotus pulmonarius]|nr:hypothetical protein EYR40_010604 [Pleurotus pulmonarius]
MCLSLSADMSMRFIDHVKEFRRLRAEFWNTPGVHEELRAYEARDNDYEYKILKGLIPKPLVGRTTNDIGPAWQKSDTFFTVRLAINTVARPGIYIVCIYRISTLTMTLDAYYLYNAVSHLDRSLITEMKTHFWDFWFSDGSINKIIHAIHDAMERRYTVVAEAYQRNDAATAPQRLAHLDAVMEECRISAADFAKKLRAGRNRVDIVYGFHAHPHHSVGHMHMHVLLADPRFRTQSTLAHDWKTLPFEAVEYVFHREEIERNRMY